MGCNQALRKIDLKRLLTDLAFQLPCWVLFPSSYSRPENVPGYRHNLSGSEQMKPVWGS